MITTWPFNPGIPARTLIRMMTIALLAVPAVAQQPDKRIATDLDAANQRIAELESRVARLENLIYATVQLSVYDAERHLEAVTREMDQNRRLFYRGLLASIEVARGQYQVERARCELELARAASGQQTWSAKIELLDAEFEFRRAKYALQENQEIASRGLVTEHQLEQNRQAVERAEQVLSLARQKLDSLPPPLPSAAEPDQPDK
jgi:hypothetical protein